MPEPTQVQKPNEEGFVLLRLHYSADPEKSDKWASKAKNEYPTEDWDREFELKPVGHKDSYPVFGDYKRILHEDENLVWLPSKGKVIYRGWDFGKVHPCVEFAQCFGNSKNYLDELYGSNILFEPFIQQVLGHSSVNFPGCTFVDWVDVSGRNEDAWGNSSIRSMRLYGLHPRGGEQLVEDGIRLMCQDMVRLEDGHPYIRLNPLKCIQLANACRGGLKRNKKGEIIKDGIHDHPVDAARYLYQGLGSDTAKDWSKIRDKLKNQYGKFPKDGRQVRR
jgi:hypothetical protein